MSGTAWSSVWSPCSFFVGLGLSLGMGAGMGGCDQAPADAKPPPRVEAPVAAAPVVDANAKAAVVVPVDPPPPAPTTAVVEPDVVPLEAPRPVEVVTPSDPSGSAAADEPRDEPGKDGAPVFTGSRKGVKKGGPTKVEAFTDCQRHETFADGHCYASHQAACEGLGCSGECLSLKSMPAQAKCL